MEKNSSLVLSPHLRASGGHKSQPSHQADDSDVMLLVVVVGGSSTPPVPPRAAEFNWRLLVGKIDELPAAALVSNGCQGLVSVYTAIECGEEHAVELSSSSSCCCCTAPPGFIH